MLSAMKRALDSKIWFLLAHGAGASSRSDWIQLYASLLENFGPVHTFDYQYMSQGKRRPDPLPLLLNCHREELAQGRAQYGDRVVLAGKSMGGRVGCHLATTENVRGVICFGYPLKPVGNGPLRDQALIDVPVPLCLLQGTRDKLCPLDLLDGVLARRKSPTTLHVVPTGDHSLQPMKTYLKTEGLTVEDLRRDTFRTIEGFLNSLDKEQLHPASA
jgi:predicted alpha/beta-hydrolase family hydrolase